MPHHDQRIIGFLVILGMIAVLCGLIFLAISQQSKFYKEDEANCSKFAELANADDHFFEGHRCYIIKGNKFTRIEM